ncbi:hypothetical protein PENTCL1PPCAC_18075 [Pristionchus entomophagus]|uniref:G protein-coupled receptor n=1 Tax=Pristionchus entomophagus TaxID=358040 RepID=A0AAV5TN90_9BILA|nr:hypothetical protein PENTCL1PPCAC_18075 [Pristionchus entomophagus]
MTWPCVNWDGHSVITTTMDAPARKSSNWQQSTKLINVARDTTSATRRPIPSVSPSLPTMHSTRINVMERRSLAKIASTHVQALYAIVTSPSWIACKNTLVRWLRFLVVTSRPPPFSDTKIEQISYKTTVFCFETHLFCINYWTFTIIASIIVKSANIWSLSIEILANVLPVPIRLETDKKLHKIREQ